MVRRIFFVSCVVVPATIWLVSLWWHPIVWSYLVVGPLMILGWYDVLQRRHTLLRIYPVIGHGRYLMEEIRPEIQQYFVESDIDGRPFNREHRSVIYQRAKRHADTTSFGTQRDVLAVGYEWMAHSMAPRPPHEKEPRVRLGGPDCRQPYDASHLNISAMSYGSLSRTAVLALNRGAAIGGFLHNTGEGSISPYHLEPGGDLVWQIGTGYFGCRDEAGRFCIERFAEQAQRSAVKAIEIKLSQGAKPGHGGILPKEKISEEVAAIRGVPMGQDIISPPAHSAFTTPVELLEFIARLRERSDGKPVGFKLCVGYPTEFLAICKAMLLTGITPDFITVDGGEGGTGAAPLELTNSVGMPLREGLRLVDNALRGVGLRSSLRVIASGKIVTGFDLFRAIALGADLCNAARSMMLALGCIQARRCNSNTCPVGIATQDPSRYRAIDVRDKAQRIANYHRETIAAFLELLGGAGLESPRQIRLDHVMRRVDPVTVKHFGEIYPSLPDGILLEEDSIPENWRVAWRMASPEQWQPLHDPPPDHTMEGKASRAGQPADLEPTRP